jgi:hypothetical protein
MVSFFFPKTFLFFSFLHPHFLFFSCLNHWISFFFLLPRLLFKFNFISVFISMKNLSFPLTRGFLKVVLLFLYVKSVRYLSFLLWKEFFHHSLLFLLFISHSFFFSLFCLYLIVFFSFFLLQLSVRVAHAPAHSGVCHDRSLTWTTK